MCPPAYYAHLAAFRGRAMLADPPDSASESSGTAGTIEVRAFTSVLLCFDSAYWHATPNQCT